MSSEGRIERAVHRNAISDGVRRAAAKYRDGAALTFAGRTWSFAEIDAAAGRVAHRLTRSRPRQGRARRRLCPQFRRLSHPVARLRACWAGARSDQLRADLGRAALHPRPVRREGAVLRRRPRRHRRRRASKPRRSRTTDSCAAATATFSRPRSTSARSGSTRRSASNEDAAQFCYTSGTTAAPKAAVMTHRAYVAEYLACAIEMEFSATRRRARGAAALSHRADARLHHAADAGRRRSRI